MAATPSPTKFWNSDGHKPQTTWLFDSALDVSYELDLFGHVRRSIEAARDNAKRWPRRATTCG